MMMDKKSQAAVEYLMSHMWALLSVVIMFSVFIYLGLVQMDNFLPDKAQIIPGIEVVNFASDEDSIILLLQNNLGKTLYSLEVTATDCDHPNRISEPITINPGKTEEVRLFCGKTSSTNSKFRSSLSVSYVTKESGYALSHASDGILRTTVMQGSETYAEEYRTTLLTSFDTPLNQPFRRYVVQSSSNPLTGLSILTDNIILDLNGNSIEGNAENNGITIEEKNNIIIENGKINNHDYGLSIINSYNIIIRNMIITGSAADGIFIDPSAGINLQDITISGSAGYGLHLDDMTHSNLTNIILTDNDAGGIYLNLCDHTNMTEIYANNNGADGILLEASTNNFFNQIETNNNLGDGISLKYGSNDNILTDIYADGNGYACFNIDETSLNNILTNALCNGVGDCIELSQSDTTYTMTQNIVKTDYRKSCINITAPNIILDCQGFSITNTYEHDTNDGFAGVHSNQPGTIIKNCTISVGRTNNQGVGINLEWANNSQIYNNTLIDNEMAIVLAYTNNVHVENVTTNSNGYGYALWGINNNSFTNLTVNSNQRGFYIWNSSHNNFSMVKAYNSQETGMFFGGESNYNHIINTIANWNQDYGIGSEGSSHNVFINITASHNSWCGVELSGNNNSIRQIQVDNNNLGLSIYYGSNNTIEGLNADSNGRGISFYGRSSYNKISNFNITDCTDSGESAIYIGSVSSNNNIIENGLIDTSPGRGIFIECYSPNNNSNNNLFKNIILQNIDSYDVNFHTMRSNSEVLNSTFINVTFDANDVRFDNNPLGLVGGDMELIRKEYYQARVTDGTNNLQGAEVKMYDKTNSLIHSWTTNSAGMTEMVELDAYSQYYDGSLVTTDYNNYTIIVSYQDYPSQSQEYNLTAEGSVVNDIFIFEDDSEQVIYDCQDLDVEGETYKLGDNVVVEGEEEKLVGCFRILANGVTLDCDGYSITKRFFQSAAVVESKNTEGIIIQNCVLTPYSGHWATGIKLRDVNHAKVANNTIINCFDSISLLSVDYSNFTGNKISNNAHSYGEGIELEKSDYNNITNNNIHDNLGTALYFHSGSSYNNISNNTFVRNGKHGVYVGESAKYNNFTNNTFRFNSLRGIQFYKSNYNQLWNNTFSDNYWDGIGLKISNNNQFFNNTVDSNAADGIWLDYYSDENAFMTNNVTNNQMNGFHNYYSSGIILTGNSFCGNVNEDVKCSGEFTVTLTDNECDSNSCGLCEFSCSQSSTPEQIIYDCQDLTEPNTIYYLNNSINNDSLITPCIYIAAPNVTLDCQGNSITTTQDVAGVYSNQDNITIKNCIIDVGESIAGFGMHLSSLSGATIINNFVSSSDYGLFMDSDVADSFISQNTFNNNVIGAYVLSSTSNILDNNVAEGNTLAGLKIETSLTNTVSNSRFCSNYVDIDCDSAQTFTNNNCDVITGFGECDSCSPIPENEVYECRVLDQPGTEYRLMDDIVQNINDNCISITAPDIVFNCQGNSITSALDVSGVYSDQDNVTIKNCIIDVGENYPGIGIRVSLNNNAKIINNSITGSYYGIYAGAYVSGSLFENNTFYNNLVGLRLWYSSGNTVRNNTGYNNGYFSFHLEPESHDNIIIDNTAISNDWAGILAKDSKNNTIQNNYVVNSTNYGIDFIRCNDSKIIYNIVTQHPSDAIIVSGGTDNIVNHNTVTHSSFRGITLDAKNSNSHVESNFIQYCDIGIHASRVNSSTFINNNADRNRVFGIYLSNASHHTLINNSANFGDWYGIVLSENSSYNEVYNNTAINNINLTGLYVDTGCYNNIIEGNEFCGNSFDVQCIAEQIFNDNMCLTPNGCGSTCNSCSGTMPYEIDQCMPLNTPNTEYLLMNDITQDEVDHCIKIIADNVTLDCQGYKINSFIYMQGYSGIFADHRKNITIKNCNIDLSYESLYSYAILFHYTNMAYIYNNTITNGYAGILLSNGSDIHILNNSINVLDTAVYVDSNSNNNVLDNNYFQANYTGINLQKDQINVTNNQIISNWVGVYAFGSNNNIINNTIEGNLYGISLDIGNSNNIINNTVSNSDRGLSSFASGNNIKNNTFCMNNIYDVYCTGGDSISDNKCDENYGCLGSCDSCSGGSFDEVYGCRVLDSPNTVYTLMNNIVQDTNEVCFNINADNIVVDCRGHYITNSIAMMFGLGAFYSYNMNGVTIKNCHINLSYPNTFSQAINLNSVNAFTIFNNTIDQTNVGIYFSGNNYNHKIIGNTITNGMSGGITGTGSLFYSLFDGNNIHGMASTGITIYGEHSNFTNNIVNSNWRGIWLTGIINKVINNTFDSNTADGIYLSLASTNNNIIQDNSVKSNSKGLHLSGSWDNTVTGNKFCSNIEDVFCDTAQTSFIDNECDTNNGCPGTCNPCSGTLPNQIDQCMPLNTADTEYIVINPITQTLDQNCITVNADNVIINCQGKTITNQGSQSAIFSNYPGTVVKNCNIDTTSSTGYGIRIEEDNSVIQNNSLTGAIYTIYLLSASYANIENNAIFSPLAIGIHVSSGSNFNTIINNSISSSDSSGMYFSGNSYNTIENNTVEDSYSNGISLWSASNNELINNTVKNNGYNGIKLFYGNYNKVINNTVHNNSVGIYYYSSQNSDILDNNVFFNTKYGLEIWYAHWSNLTGNSFCMNSWDAACPGTTLRNAFNNNCRDESQYGCGNSCTPCSYPECYDLDIAEDYFFVSTAAFNSTFSGRDNCTEDYTLSEYSCIGSDVIETSTSCIVGCEDGACLYCDESDGSINYDEFGTGYNLSGSYDDTCIDSNTVREYYCAGEVLFSTTYTCPTGCSAGACNKIEEIDICSTLDKNDYEYVLTGNVVQDLNQDCMIIQANNVTLDCKGFSISSSYPISIVNSSWPDTTVKNCNISVGWGEYPDYSYGIKIVAPDSCAVCDGPSIDNHLILNNTIEGGYGGLWMIYTNDSRIVNNTFRKNLYGLRLNGGQWSNEISGNNLLEGNIFESNGGYGDGMVFSRNKNLTVRNNLVFGNNYNGIELRTDANTIDNNTIFANGRGILLNEHSNQITNNIIVQNTRSGIVLTTASMNTISDNIICSNSEQGIWAGHLDFGAASFNNIVENNIIRANTNSIYVSSDSTGNQFTGNDLCDSIGDDLICGIPQIMTNNNCGDIDGCGGSCNACVATSCTETDSGMDLATKGTLNYAGEALTDYCFNKNTIVEYYCSGSVNINVSYCDCLNGECI